MIQTDPLKNMIEEATATVKDCDELTEEKVWYKHGVSIWKANRFISSPYFYPVYRYKDLYSYSPLSLILYKKRFNLHPQVAKKVAKDSFNYLSGENTIDSEIMRMGGPPSRGCVIKGPDEYAKRIAEAVKQDVAEIEDAHPGFTNIILCGGKDSLNLLLLPWKNPVVIASAPPNYDFVKVFAQNIGLNVDVLPLRDDDNSLLELEILANCCRNNLEHCRWGPTLRELSLQFNKRVIFWKGQLGDTFMTPYWKTYTHPQNLIGLKISKIFRFVPRFGQRKIKQIVERSNINKKYFYESQWYRGAMWQGAHMSIIRQLTDSLVLSGYHGPAMQKVLSEVDLKSAVQKDVRPLVGKYLNNSPVPYPEKNPSPAGSNIRKGISHLEPFLKTLSSIGISVDTGDIQMSFNTDQSFL